MMERLKDKVVLISGAAQGIGREIACVFAREGARVVIGDIQDQAGVETASQIKQEGQSAQFVRLDVTDKNSWERAIQNVMILEHRLDILVNNAGISTRLDFEELSVDVWDRVMAVNVKGAFLGTQQVIPIMRKQGGGVIINMSSICGLVGHKFSSPSYVASKGAITLFTKAIASQYAADKIRANSIHPSTADTPLVAELFRDPVKKKQRFDEVPLGRLATMADIANAALFLASDEADFITGVAFPVDGGLTAY